MVSVFTLDSNVTEFYLEKEKVPSADDEQTNPELGLQGQALVSITMLLDYFTRQGEIIIIIIKYLLLSRHQKLCTEMSC